MKIAVDIMGSDLGPAEIIAGAIQWSIENQQPVILVGPEAILAEELEKYDFPAELIEVVPASETITMEDVPATAVRAKKDASVVVATKLVHEKQADALVSCGNTGAQMASALLMFGRIAGVERPPLAIPLPNIRGGITLLVDGGANVDCSAKQLLEFALLGQVYAAEVFKIPTPKVALLNNGSEAKKGNRVTAAAHQLIAAQAGLHFIGNLEGREVLTGMCDILVCDGFVGNIVIKALEGVVGLAAKSILAMGNAIPEAITRLDYRQIGGVILLGLKGISMVCHGSSNREAVYSGMQAARFCVENEVVAKQTQALALISHV